MSLWELSVKHALGKLPLPGMFDRFIVEERERHGIAALPLNEPAVLHLHTLPLLHRDPFDRMPICQAIEHGCVLLTTDLLIGNILSERGGKSALARIIHERFCCNRGFAALAREASFLTRRSYLVSRRSQALIFLLARYASRFTFHERRSS